MQTRQKQIFAGGQPPQLQFFGITSGVVVDTNDPQEMGRIRVVCQLLGDRLDTAVTDIPWALYMSPFGGMTEVGTRGSGTDPVNGSTAYGMWAIPKVGANVGVMCLNGNPMQRIWVGCVYEQHTPHTLPHGRYMTDTHPALETDGMAVVPNGPYAGNEKFIQPLRANLATAFNSKGTAENHEFATRGADYSASSVDADQLSFTFSSVADDDGIAGDNWTSTQGYSINRQDPHAPTPQTKRNYDSMVTSITSAGFHSVSMDDRQENCRVRLRTTSGHQILLDDTNERIYISTAEGRNWIEMDQAGNIDGYTSGKINLHAEQDINLTSDKTVRLFGKEGIHAYTDGEMNLQAKKDINIKTDTQLQVKAGTTTKIETGTSLYLKSGTDFKATAGTTMDLLSTALFQLSSTANLTLLAGAVLALDGQQIQLNNQIAQAADSASSADPAKAKWTSRVPLHEPFGRCSTKDDYSHEPELDYSSSNMGKVDSGRPITRGHYWRR